MAIDIGPEQVVGSIVLDKQPDNDAFIRAVLLENLSLSRMWENLFKKKRPGPVVAPTTQTIDLAAIKQTIEEGPLARYEQHGADVAKVYSRIAEKEAEDPRIYMVSLQNIIDPGDVEFIKSQAGEDGVQFLIRAEPVVEALSRLSSPPRVVNMSFMMGENRLFRDARGIYRIESALSGDNAQNSMQEFAKVANAFPATLFVAAAGNNGEDLRRIQEEQSQPWPKNGLFVAEWGEDQPADNILGADLYVDSGSFGIQPGSSFATPVVAGLAASIMDEGATAIEARNLLLQRADERAFVSEYGHTLARVLSAANVFSSN